MQVITLDGPAKAGKTCIGTELEVQLASEGRVELQVAGNFFRTITAGVIDTLGLEGDGVLPVAEELDGVIKSVLALDCVYDGTYAWGNLHRPAINGLVAVVGKRKITQQAAEEWYKRIAFGASENDADILVVDGRNPRARLQEPMNALNLQTVSLDLFVTCSVETAAARSLASSPRRIIDPTARQLSQERAGLARRRRLDMTRPHNPFIKPHNPVVVNGQAAQDVVHETYKAADHDPTLPRAVWLDTTDMSKPFMKQRATEIAKIALKAEE